MNSEQTKQPSVMTEEDFIIQYLPEKFEMDAEQLDTACRMLKDYHKYHLSQLQADAELPTLEDFENRKEHYADFGSQDCFEWMRDKATLSLSKLKQENEELREEIRIRQEQYDELHAKWSKD